MIRVVHVVRPATGGIRQHVLELLTRADPARVSQALAAPSAFLAALPAGLALAGQVSVEIAPAFSPGADLLAASRLAQFARGRADLLHAHGLRAGFIAALACRLRPLPLLLTAHNLIGAGPLTRLGLRMIASRATQAIAVSHSVAEGLAAAGFNRDKIRVIPNGVDTEYFKPPDITPGAGGPHPGAGGPHPGAGGPHPGASADPLPSLGEGKVTVGCVARLSPEKGIDVLLRAAALRPEMEFLIAGDGPQRAALERLAPSNARLLGRVADTRELYRAANIIAIPSRQEGQGIVALEALACGLPVVASRIGGLAEMLTDSETALLVPPDQHQALAEALQALRDNTALRQTLSTNGPALVRKHYDVRAMVAAVEETYRSLIAS